MKDCYRRFLPHWHPNDTWLFVTWRLAGSQPRNPTILTADLPEGKRFALLNEESDRATTGPLWLADPRIALIVKDMIIQLDGSLYELAAWVIMANHVHMVILPNAPMQKIMQKLKGSTAHTANQILRRKGAFWAIEYYDRWIRSEDEFNNVIRYGERNPVKAGLAESVCQWPWSSATQTKVCVTDFPKPFRLLPAQ